MKAELLLLLLLATSNLAGAQEHLSVAAVPVPQHKQHAAGAKGLTLAELEAAALENNLEIALLARHVEVAAARTAAAGALEDPSFMYRRWGVPLREPWNFNQPQNMFMVIQSFPGPGKRALRGEIAAQAIDIAKADLEAKKRDVTAKVRMAFYELRRNQDELRLHDQQVVLARQAIEAARIKYTVGRAPQQDILKAQIALSRLVDHLTMFEQESQLARARLNTLLGRDPATPLEVAGEYAVPGRLPPLPELERIALQNRPELLAASASVKQGETRARLAGKAYTPDFALGAGYMLMPPGSRFRNTYMAELSVSLPWLNRRKHESEIAQAKAEASALEAAYNSQRAMVLQEIQEARIRAEAARKLVELYRDTLRPQAQTTLKAAAAAYQTDRTDFLNLLDSQNAALEVEYAYFRALSEYERQVADLQRAIGGPLPGAAAPSKDQTSEEVR